MVVSEVLLGIQSQDSSVPGMLQSTLNSVLVATSRYGFTVHHRIDYRAQLAMILQLQQVEVGRGGVGRGGRAKVKNVLRPT